MKRNTKTRRTSIISLVMQKYVQMLHPYIFTKSDIHMHIYKHVPSHFSHVQLFVTLWTVACQAPLSIGFPRQEYWSGLLYPPSGDLPDPGSEPASLMSPALAAGLFTASATWDTLVIDYI